MTMKAIGRLLETELGKSGVTKENKPWQIVKYAIEIPEGKRYFSAFQNFNMPLGSMVEIEYKEMPNPNNVDRPYRNVINMTASTQQMPKHEAQLDMSLITGKEEVSQPQPKKEALLSQAELETIANVYKAKVQVSDWSANHFVGTVLRTVAQRDTVLKAKIDLIVEYFNSKVMAK